MAETTTGGRVAELVGRRKVLGIGGLVALGVAGCRSGSNPVPPQSTSAPTTPASAPSPIAVLTALT